MVPPTSPRRIRSSPLTGAPARTRVPLHRQLSDALRTAISAGKLRVGQTLPTEHALAERYGVSRITVRHALSDLEREGLVRRRRPTGNVVASSRPRPHHGWSFESLRDVVAFGEQTKVEILSFGNRRAPADVAELFGVSRRALLPCAHGLRLMHAAPLSEFRFWISPMIAGNLTRDDLVQPTLFSVIENRLGVKLIRAEQTVWCEPAGRDVARMLRMSPTSPVLAIRRVYIAEGDVPVEIAVSRFHGARYRLQHVLHRVSNP